MTEYQTDNAADIEKGFSKLEELGLSILKSGDYLQQKATIEKYEDLLERERYPADPQEVMRVSIDPGGKEGRMLQEAGIKNDHHLTREELMQAGFVFVNTIGNGEKPLLSGVIDDGNGRAVDLSHRTLLTQKEIDTVRSLQPKPELDDEVTRMLMIDFMNKADDALRSKCEVDKEMFVEAQRRISGGVAGEEAKVALARYIAMLLKDETGLSINWAMQECLMDIDTVKVGSIPVSTFPVRRQALNGLPSPFLDSGYRFGENSDVTLWTHSSEKTRRLNTVVVHLLSRGINEIGGAVNGSHDQTYITSDEFAKLLPLAAEQDASTSDEEVALVVDRLLFRATN